MTLAQILSTAVVFHSGFVVVSSITVLAWYYRRGHRMRRHVHAMISSYFLLTFVIAYNVTMGHVQMPPLTAIAALVGFGIGDAALTGILLGLVTTRSRP